MTVPRLMICLFGFFAAFFVVGEACTCGVTTRAVCNAALILELEYLGKEQINYENGAKTKITARVVQVIQRRSTAKPFNENAFVHLNTPSYPDTCYVPLNSPGQKFVVHLFREPEDGNNFNANLCNIFKSTDLVFDWVKYPQKSCRYPKQDQLLLEAALAPKNPNCVGSQCSGNPPYQPNNGRPAGKGPLGQQPFIPQPYPQPKLPVQTPFGQTPNVQSFDRRSILIQHPGQGQSRQVYGNNGPTQQVQYYPGQTQYTPSNAGKNFRG